MYSYEERKKAIKLYIRYGKRASNVVKELGYPVPKVLVKWYKDYIDKGKIEIPDKKFTNKQKNAAIRFYLEHGKNITYTITELGYPSYRTLYNWIHEKFPEIKRVYTPKVPHTIEEKIQAVLELNYNQTEKGGNHADGRDASDGPKGR